MNREKVMKAIEICIKNGCKDGIPNQLCPYSSEVGCDLNQILADALELLKEQEELIKAMKRDLNLVRSCKVCGNWTECTPDAPPESEEFKMWRDCGGSCKLNWTWRGV